MKKIFVIIFALLLFSCSQNNKILETNSWTFSNFWKEEKVNSWETEKIISLDKLTEKQEKIFYEVADKYFHIPDEIKITLFQGISLKEEFDKPWVEKLFKYLNYITPRLEDKKQKISTYDSYCFYNDLPNWIKDEFSMDFIDYLYTADKKLAEDYHKKYFVSYSPSWEYYCDEILQKNN